MIKIEDLTGIPEWKRKRVFECLDSLLTFRDNEGKPSPVITGYNWYDILAKTERYISFSHMHETEEYKREMLRDIKSLDIENLKWYDESTINKKFIRKKSSKTVWRLGWKIDVPGLVRVYDVRNPEVNLLEKYTGKTINTSPEFKKRRKNLEGHLIGESHGWQLDIPFNNERELRMLSDLFLKKSQKGLKDVWSEAYTVPVILIGKKVFEYGELEGFGDVIMFYLEQGENEICFIVSKKKMKRFETINEYGYFEQNGFLESEYKANKVFIKKCKC